MMQDAACWSCASEPGDSYAMILHSSHHIARLASNNLLLPGLRRDTKKQDIRGAHITSAGVVTLIAARLSGTVVQSTSEHNLGYAR